MKRSLTARTALCALRGGCALMAGGFAALALGGASYAKPGDGNWYFFGDSSTGQGNHAALLEQRGETQFPYSSNNGFRRLSNGLVWSEMMGRDVDIVLDPDRDSNNVNFAFSGAHITASGDLAEFGLYTGVQIQTAIFAEMVEAGEASVGADDVAFIMAGANDLMDRAAAGEDFDAIIADIAEAGSDNITTLGALGVKTVLMAEVRPIKFAPLVRDDAEAQAAFAEAVDAANIALFDAAVAAADAAGVNLVTVRDEAFLTYIRDNAAALGFDEVDRECYLEDADTVCAPDMAGQNRYLFLDDLHFTEAGQLLTAQWWQATLAGANGEAARPVLMLPSLVSAGLEMSEQSVWTGARQGPGVFGDLAYQDVKFDFDGLAADVRLKALSFGGAYRLTDVFSAGAALRHDDAEIRFANGDRQDYAATTLTGFLRYAEDGYGLTAAVSHSWLDFEDGVRQTGVRGLSARTGFDGEAWQASLLSDAAYEWGVFDLQVSNSLQYDAIRIDGATETGATGLALRYGAQSLNAWRFDTHLDVRMDGWRVAENVTLAPVGAVGWTWRSNADHSLVSQLIDNTADPVTLFGEGLAENSFETRLGLEAQIAERFTAGLSYGRGWGDDRHSDDRIALTVRARF